MNIVSLPYAVQAALVCDEALPAGIFGDTESAVTIETLANLIDSAVDQGLSADDLAIVTERAYRIVTAHLRLVWQYRFHDTLGEWFEFRTPAMEAFVGVDIADEFTDVLPKVS